MQIQTHLVWGRHEILPFNKLPGDADAAGPWTIHCKAKL